MKKLILISIVFLFAFTVNVFAQDASATSTATANVISQLTITSGGALDFGDVSAETSPEIDPTDSEAIQFDVSGSVGETFYVGFPSSVDLTNSGTDELQLNVALRGAQASTDQGSSSIVNDGDDYPLTDGDYYFWFGGTITDIDGSSNIPNSKLGEFTGDFTIEVGYSSF